MEYENTHEFSYHMPNALLACKKGLEIEGHMENCARVSVWLWRNLTAFHRCFQLVICLWLKVSSKHIQNTEGIELGINVLPSCLRYLDDKFQEQNLAQQSQRFLIRFLENYHQTKSYLLVVGIISIL